MLDYILQKDTELLIFLNNLGSEQWDAMWMAITKQFNWVPLFAIILILVFVKFGTKRALFLLLFIAGLVAFSDQFTNFVKYTFGRVRPCNVPELQEYLRQFSYKPRGFSFWSGHAATSTTFTTFIVLLFRKHYKLIYLMILFPLVFGYSRIYLGVHYPIDVSCGYIAGICVGYGFYKLFQLLHLKIFKQALA